MLVSSILSSNPMTGMLTAIRQINLGRLIHIATIYSTQGAIAALPSATTCTSPCFVSCLASAIASKRAKVKRRFMASKSTHDAAPNSFENICEQKRILRKQIRSAMKNLTTPDIEVQSKKVWERVINLPIYQKSKSVGLFLSMPKGEINTDFIIEDCVKNDKDIYVPEVGKDFELCDMELRKVIQPNRNPTEIMFHKMWPKNKWKIPEPPSDMPTVTAKPGDIDLMIVPGLGFDRKGNRLGQGKGYYDRFVAKMTKDGQELPLVAVALRPQLVENTQIPVASYDQQMDMLVLPDEIIFMN